MDIFLYIVSSVTNLMVLFRQILYILTIAVVADMVLCWFDEGNSQQLFPSLSCTLFYFNLFFAVFVDVNYHFVLVSADFNSISICTLCQSVRKFLQLAAVKSMTCANRRLHRKLSYTDENGAPMVMKGFWHDVLQKNIEWYSPLTNCEGNLS